MYSLVNGDPEKLLDHPLLEVMRVKREVEDPMGLNWSRQNIQQISPTVGLVKTVVGNSNVILHRLLGDAGVSYRVLLTLNRIGGNQFMVSLRSSDGEALPVARQLQGGGHPNAAGAALPKSVQRVADAVEYLKKALNPIDDGNGPAGLNTEALFENVES
jgi:hypothetical protein